MAVSKRGRKGESPAAAAVRSTEMARRGRLTPTNGAATAARANEVSRRFRNLMNDTSRPVQKPTASGAVGVRGVRESGNGSNSFKARDRRAAARKGAATRKARGK